MRFPSLRPRMGSRSRVSLLRQTICGTRPTVRFVLQTCRWKFRLQIHAATTADILLAIEFEERDLIDAHGDAYRRYRNSVPMLVPFTRCQRPVLGEEQIPFS